MATDDVLLLIHGPRPPVAPAQPIVPGLPHSGQRMPADFGAAASRASRSAPASANG